MTEEVSLNRDRPLLIAVRVLQRSEIARWDYQTNAPLMLTPIAAAPSKRPR